MIYTRTNVKYYMPSFHHTLGPAGPESPLAPSRPLKPCTHHQGATGQVTVHHDHHRKMLTFFLSKMFFQTHSVSLDARKSRGSRESTSSLQEGPISRCVIEFFFCAQPGHLSTNFALQRHHSPEGQQLHAHQDGRVFQHHPVGEMETLSRIKWDQPS